MEEDADQSLAGAEDWESHSRRNHARSKDPPVDLRQSPRPRSDSRAQKQFQRATSSSSVSVTSGGESSVSNSAVRRSPDRAVLAASSVYSRDVDESSSRVPTYHPLQLSPVHDDPLSPSGLPEEEPDISPPDSPIDVNEAQTQDSPDISPLCDKPEPLFGNMQKPGHTSSQLPGMNKNAFAESPPGTDEGHSTTGSRRQSPTWSPDPRQTRESSWPREPLSGDSADERQGRQAENKIQRQADTGQPEEQRSGRTRFQVRKRLGTKSRDRESKQSGPHGSIFLPRQPWKGASGRSPVIAPLETRPGPGTLSLAIPGKKHNNGAERKFSMDDLGFSSRHGYTITTITAGDGQEREVGNKQTCTRGSGQGIPVRPEHTAPAPQAIHDQRKIEPLGRAVENEPSGQGPQIEHPTVPPVEPPEDIFVSQLQDISISNEPASRFSATTYATTAADNSIADLSRVSVDSDVTPMPSMSQSPMVSRRPLPSAEAAIKSTTRKPIRLSGTAADLETSKALPQSPPELNAQSRIEALKARQDDLSRRKRNLNILIYELTQVIQPSSIAYDMATRDEVKKRVASLNNELDEVRKEEHEVGLKLVRAWKKRDEQDVYGGSSSLWVRRVTTE